MLGVAVFTSLTTIAAYKWVGLDQTQVVFQNAATEDRSNDAVIKFAKSGDDRIQVDSPIDFTEAAAKVTPSVVHIVSTQEAGNQFSGRRMPSLRDFFGDDFFGDGSPREAQASGSGVIISQDGYIVTNNHVVENSSKVEVILNDKKNYEAEIIGTDPSTDLAVIKIKETGLPNILLGSSENIKVGQWVLAVGNPFNLESTVTAGIISAKGRSLNILRNKDRAPIESFIQTDAAVNPGNSGGALVNTQGELIGINTAIATQTGSFSGYSFAVPVDLMNKVVKDIIEYGTVQRAFLGIRIRELDGKYAEELNLNITEGVRVESISANSAAAEAGLEVGDVIVGIDGKIINSTPELLEEVAKRRPGNKITVKVLRNNKYKDIDVFLKNNAGNEQLVSSNNSEDVLQSLGLELEELDKEALKEFGLEYGLRVNRLYDGKITRNTDIREGFIIQEVGDESVKSIDDFLKAYNSIPNGRGVFLSGTYPQADGNYYFAFPK